MVEIKTYSLPFVQPSRSSTEYKLGELVVDSPNDVTKILTDYNGDFSKFPGHLALHAKGKYTNLLMNVNEHSKEEIMDNDLLLETLKPGQQQLQLHLLPKSKAANGQFGGEEEEEQQQGETPEDEGDEEGDDEEDEEGNEGEEEEEEMDEDAMDALAAKISRSFARRLHPGLELPEGEARPAQQSPWWVAEANGEVAHAKGRSFGAFSKQRRGIVSLKELTQEEGVHGIGSSRQSRDARAKTMGSQGKVDPSAAVDLLGQMNKELVAPRLDGKARVPKANETKESKAVETGAGWYNMASPELTQEIKTDLRILAHRNYLNPKRFYKKEEQKKKLPKHFQIGKIVSGAHEYHNRLTKKQQSKNLVEELNNDSYTKNYLKRKFTEIQSSKDRKGKGKKWSKKKQREKAGKKKLK